MKRKPSKTGPDSSAAPRGHRFARAYRRVLRISRALGLFVFRLVLVLAILLILLVSYLHIVGLPRPILDDILDRLAAEGWHLRVANIRLAIDRGFVASSVEVYEDADAPVPFLTADSLSAAVSPFLLLRHGTVAPTLELADGRIRLDFGGANGTARRTLAADRIRLRFSARDGELVFRDFSADCLGIRFRGHGAVYLGDTTSSSSGGNPLRAAMDALAATPEPALQAIDTLNSMRFGEPPEARFTFQLYPGHPEANACAFRLSAADGVAVAGLSFDRFSAEATWRDSRLDIPQIAARAGGGTLSLSGWWDSAADLASVSFLNTLPASVLLPALPDAWRNAAADAVSPLDFPVRIAASSGPAAPAALPDAFSGTVSAGPLTAMGIPVRSVSAAFSRDGDTWALRDVTLEALRGDAPCALSVPEATYHPATSAFSARIRGNVWPDLLLSVPAIPPDSIVRDLIGRFAFVSPPEANLRLSGTVEPFDFSLRGLVTGRDVSLHGEPVDTVEALISASPVHFAASNVKMSRPEGAARGEAFVSFTDELVRLDVDTTFAPRAICKLLGPTVEEFAEPFRMEGPCHSQLRGTLDFHNFARTDLVGHADGQRLGFGRWETDTATADVSIRGYRINVSNIVARAWGGSLSGEAAFFPVRTSDAWHFEVAADAKKVDLAALLAASLENPPPDMRGAVSFSGTVSGDTSPDIPASLAGSGKVSIGDATLFKTRLLSGLSSILQNVVPGFDWVVNTDARAEFRIRDGVLRIPQATIATPLLGLTASGSYRFDNTLDFEAEGKLLRRGVLASVVQFVTSPVTRLLKFRLSGSFENPSWSAVNLNPKRLLKLVDPSTYTSSTPSRAPAAPLPVPESAR